MTSNSLSESRSHPSLLADLFFIHAWGATHSWVRELTLLSFDWSQCPTFLAGMHRHRHRLGFHPDHHGLHEMLQKLKALHSIYTNEAGTGGQDQSGRQSVSGPSRTPKNPSHSGLSSRKIDSTLCLLPRLAQNKGHFSMA